MANPGAYRCAASSSNFLLMAIFLESASARTPYWPEAPSFHVFSKLRAIRWSGPSL